MNPIRILSPDLLLLAEIDDYESLQFTRSYNGIGTFELHINNNKRHVDKLQKRNLIMLNNNPNKVGIITYREIGLDGSGKASETWVITGSTLEIVTKQRITIPPPDSITDTKEGAGESLIKHYINNHLVNPLNPNRKIVLLEIMPDLQRGSFVSKHSKFKPLDEELIDISTLSGVGWMINLDLINKKWVADCYVGADRTINQTENPPIIFSPNFETLEEATYSDSDLDFKNVAYVSGEVEVNTGTENSTNTDDNNVEEVVVEVGESVGIDRFEIHGSISKEEPDYTNYGNSILHEHKDTISFEGKVNIVNSPFVYEQDWFLGDLVTIQHTDWKVTMDTRITEVTEIYEPSNVRIEVTFGKAKPTLISKIKSELKRK